MEEYTFKVVEENDDKLKSVIEMSGLSTKFTALDVMEHLSYVKKTLKETTAQLEAEAIQDKMAIEIIPELATLPESKMQLVMAYAARQVEKADKQKLIEACGKTLTTYEDRLEQIKKVLGLKSIEELEVSHATPSPYVAPQEEDKEL